MGIRLKSHAKEGKPSNQVSAQWLFNKYLMSKRRLVIPGEWKESFSFFMSINHGGEGKNIFKWIGNLSFFFDSICLPYSSMVFCIQYMIYMTQHDFFSISYSWEFKLHMFRNFIISLSVLIYFLIQTFLSLSGDRLTDFQNELMVAGVKGGKKG